MIDFIAGRAVKLLNGLNSLKVLIIETLAIEGNNESKLVSTTKKSNQFQASLKYEPLSSTKPSAIIFMIASEVNITMKNGSA